MPEASKEKLEEFALKGGRLVWVDDASKISCNGISTDLKILLKPLIQFESAQAAIRVCKSKFENGNLYFITNEDIKKELKCVAKFNEKWPPVGLDLETGYCHPLPEAAESEGIWSIPLKLSFAGSCMILFSSERISLFPCVPKASKTLLSLEKGWHGRRVKLYRIGKTDFEIKDILNEKAISIKLGDWRKIFGDDFSGDAEYSITFECDNTTAERASFLDFGKVNYSCEAFLNGENLGRRGWRPFCFPIKGKLKEGKNEIRIIVTNTIANQFATTKELDKWSESLIGQYHKKALCFSADSLPSGLFGPVRIQAEKGN
jgi:hypothetical protein